MASPVHYTVHDLPIFTYESANDPPSPPHDSSAESVTPKGNPKPRNNQPNTVPKIPAEQDSDPSWLDYSLTESSNSSDDAYYKQRQRAKKDKKKCQSKTCFGNQSKSTRILQPSYLRPPTNKRTLSSNWTRIQ